LARPDPSVDLGIDAIGDERNQEQNETNGGHGDAASWW